MTIALITAPANEPISLVEAKEHLRIDHDHEDNLIEETIKSARQYTEFASGQKMITQSWRQYESCFPSQRQIAIKVSPVQSIAAVTAFSSDGTPHVLSSDDIHLMRGHDPAHLLLADDVKPELAHNGFELDIVAGIGDLGIDVPDTLKRAILLLVAHWYEFRGAIPPSQQPVSLPPGFSALMMPFRRAHL